MYPTITSKIDGDFTGFQGETIIKLLNGQVWQQTEYFYQYHYGYCLSVQIYHDAVGYVMEVDGIGRRVRVSQVSVVTEGIIVSEFNGFGNDNLYEFRNGQIWKQVESRHQHRHINKPRAMVIDGLNGRVLKVDTIEEVVRVRRQ